MKRQIRILLICFIILFCVSLSACGFVNYIKYDAATDDATVEEALEEYLEKLRALSNEEYYREDERRQYVTAMLDAENELRECKTLTELEQTYERHAEIILAIPTDIDLTIEYLCGQLRASLPDNALYREAEWQAILGMLEEQIEKMLVITNATEGEKLIYEFKTLVALVKTDAQYDAEELAALKKEYDGFGDDLNYAKYPTEDHEALRSLLIDFSAELDAVTTADEGNALVEDYTAKLDAILTLEQKLSRDRAAWGSEWLARLNSFASEYSLSAEQKIADCIAQIKRQSSPEDADKLGYAFMLSYADAIGSKGVSDVRSAAIGYVGSLATPDRYRDAQKNEISQIVTQYSASISNADSVESMISFTNEARAEIEQIPTNEQLWKSEDSAFAQTMNTKYGSYVLTPPEKLDYATSVKELAGIIDYYAFYQLDGKSFERGTFRVKLDFAHKYADFVIKDVYWYCELLRSAVGICGEFEKDTSYLVVTLTPYELASKSNTDEPVKVERSQTMIEYNYGGALTDRADDFDAFPYYEAYAGRYITVWNSQQLWYALEHEYIPLPVENSPAERVLERAKEILRDIIKDGMTIEQKVFAIYSWYASNVTYDHGYWYYLLPEDRTNYPDSLVATLNSFHAEGALFDNLAVCCAYAKSALILMRIEGIEAYRVILHDYRVNAIDNIGKAGYGSHAIIALRASDGKFYYCDVNESEAGQNAEYQKYHQLLVPVELHSTYSGAFDLIWTELDYATEFPMELFWNNIKIGDQSVLVESEEALVSLIDQLLATQDKTLQINVFSYGDSDFSIKDLLDSYETIKYFEFEVKGFAEYIIRIS